MSIMKAVAEKTTPIVCAKRFGGPATNLVGLPKTGTITRVASRPMGLKVGPVATRARNPYNKNPATN